MVAMLAPRPVAMLFERTAATAFARTAGFRHRHPPALQVTTWRARYDEAAWP